MHWLSIALLVLGLSLGFEVEARVYQWVSPTSGHVQLSGNPPSWYRSSAGGPRVLVFERGNLVDDTAIKVPLDQAEQLRRAAFRETAARQRREAVVKLERAARRAASRKNVAKRNTRSGASTAEPIPDEVPQKEADPLDETEVERLRRIISAFDQGTAAPE